MKKSNTRYCTIIAFTALFNLPSFSPIYAQGSKELDARVEVFLKKHKGEWHDLNVPYRGGRL